MKNLFLLLLFMYNFLFAGLTKISYPNYSSDADIFINESNIRFSTLIKLKFSTNIIDLPIYQRYAKISDVKNKTIQNFLLHLNQQFGPIKIIKEVPSFIWGDTIRKNIRTGEKVVIRDLSQIFRIKTSRLIQW